MRQVLLALGVFLFGIAAICAFGFHAHATLFDILGIDSLGFAAVALSSLVRS